MACVQKSEHRDHLSESILNQRMSHPTISGPRDTEINVQKTKLKSSPAHPSSHLFPEKNVAAVTLAIVVFEQQTALQCKATRCNANKMPLTPEVKRMKNGNVGRKMWVKLKSEAKGAVVLSGSIIIKYNFEVTRFSRSGKLSNRVTEAVEDYIQGGLVSRGPEIVEAMVEE